MLYRLIINIGIISEINEVLVCQKNLHECHDYDVINMAPYLYFINSNITRACGFTEKIMNDEVISDLSREKHKLVLYLL